MSAASKHPGLRNSPRFRVFVITFAAVYAVAYCVALRNNWPLFSYRSEEHTSELQSQ